MPARLSDAFKSHPLNLQLKHPDFSSLQELPDSYAWSQNDDQYPSSPGSFGAEQDSVPVIDLSDPNALKLTGHACRTWGVFQVTNHGIPSKLLDDIESAGRSLFSLPVQQKLKAARSPDGISGYGFARISSFFQKLMWSEGFTIVGSPLDHFRQLWPQDYNKFCNIIEEYEKRCIRCLTIEFVPGLPGPGSGHGFGSTYDSTLLTILYQNNTSGLQVLREGTGWVTVPPLPGALVVNVGDLIHILSNGLYPSVLHRAVVNRSRHRLSIAYLYGPPASVQISPLSKLLGPSQPPLYRPITWNEYLGTKAKHFNKALSSVRLCAPLNALVDVSDHNSVKVG
ncbi:gibberellin 3-beta hydroxylase [Prunus yedoensis var. nudiflora]|uniref:Gibberellin 3-beta hydroxylase n=1 Tax=Prunus yedoensis var. nudiflora TaxID=2094558 RepID=A0A314YJ39_PRUYE|nr:gibberellin 3-beta hydroxylase [Prunus yedoensis var. nudiflora]